MKKLTPEERNEILKDNNVSAMEFMKMSALCECKTCNNQGFEYMKKLLEKSEPNSLLKDVLDHIYENTEHLKRCPVCNEMIYRQ